MVLEYRGGAVLRLIALNLLLYSHLSVSIHDWIRDRFFVKSILRVVILILIASTDTDKLVFFKPDFWDIT